MRSEVKVKFGIPKLYTPDTIILETRSQVKVTVT